MHGEMKVRKERLYSSQEYYQRLVNQGYKPGFNPEQSIEEELKNLVKFKIKRVSKENVNELKRKIDVILEK